MIGVGGGAMELDAMLVALGGPGGVGGLLKMFCEMLCGGVSFGIRLVFFSSKRKRSMLSLPCGSDAVRKREMYSREPSHTRCMSTSDGSPTNSTKAVSVNRVSPEGSLYVLSFSHMASNVAGSWHWCVMFRCFFCLSLSSVPGSTMLSLTGGDVLGVAGGELAGDDAGPCAEVWVFGGAVGDFGRGSAVRPLGVSSRRSSVLWRLSFRSSP